MTAIRRRLAPAPARRMIRDAGPPTPWVIVGFVTGGVVAIALDLVVGIRIAAFLAIVLVAVTVPSIVDVDGWRIRRGMAWLAVEQRRRQSGLPRTAAGAERWLARSDETASPMTRASVELMAGRIAEARALVESAPRDTPEDAARAARILAAIDGLETGSVDQEPARAAIQALPAEARRYHLLSLAWSTAWVDSIHGSPWRHTFADASRGIRLTELPVRALLWISVQELLAPIVVGFVLLGGLILGWW